MSASRGRVRPSLALLLLSTAASGALLTAAPVTAQEASTLDEIVVTGTLIRGVAPTGTNVVAVTNADVVTTGVASSNDLLARVPQIASFNSTPSPGSTIANPINRPNIRALGASGGSTTLLLLNGKRMVGAGVLQTSPDPTAIPPGVIERVEVIPDGGSSIYGSDAIGGVINFITRKEFDGVEITGRYGFADSYRQTDVNITGGHKWSGGSATLSYAYADHDNVLGSQRDYVHSNNRPFGGSDLRVSNCSPGTITVGQATYALPSRTPGINLCDESKLVDLYPSEERHSIFGTLSQQITDGVDLDVTTYYSKRETTRVGISAADGTGLRGGGTITSANPYFRTVAGETSQTVAFSYAPAFGAAETNPSTFDSLGFTPSLTFALPHDWRLVASANYGRSNNEVRTFQTDTVAEAAALAGRTTATALNPYDVNATNPAVLAAIRNFEIRGESVQEIAELRGVADGTLFQLSGRDVKLAVGAEYHEESIDASQGQGPRGAPVLFHASSRRDVKSVFGEVLAPILGPDSGAGSLDLSASVRFDSYSDVGDTTNPKLGFTYKPSPEFQVRGNWGTSFHAPSLADTGNAVDTRAQVLAVSPFRPASSPFSDLFRPTILLAGGNPDLKPEEAETWSLGFDWTPTGVLEGLTVSATYYNVEFTDAIGLAPFYTGAVYFANPGYSAFYVLNPTAAQAIAATAGQRVENAPSIAGLFAGGPPPFALIDARRQNLGSVLVDGIDFNIRYRWDTGFGSMNAGLAGTYTLSRKSQAVAGAPQVNELKNGTGRYSVVGTLGAAVGDVNGQLTVNRSDGYPVLGVVGQASVDTFTTVNLFLSYDLKMGGWLEESSLTLNVDNLLEEDPPYYNDSDGYANGSTLGRLISVGFRKTF